MNVIVKKENEFKVAPMLFPYEPDQFWQRMRLMIREEIGQVEKAAPTVPAHVTPGMQYKPLYMISEVCTLFHVSKPTVYDWTKHGKLKPVKIRARVYFLWQDIQNLLADSKLETPTEAKKI